MNSTGLQAPWGQGPGCAHWLWCSQHFAEYIVSTHYIFTQWMTDGVHEWKNSQWELQQPLENTHVPQSPVPWRKNRQSPANELNNYKYTQEESTHILTRFYIQHAEKKNIGMQANGQVFLQNISAAKSAPCSPSTGKQSVWVNKIQHQPAAVQWSRTERGGKRGPRTH